MHAQLITIYKYNILNDFTDCMRIYKVGSMNYISGSDHARKLQFFSNVHLSVNIVTLESFCEM